MMCSRNVENENASLVATLLGSGAGKRGGMQPPPRLHDIDRREAEQHRQRADDLKIDQGPQSQPSQPVHVLDCAQAVHHGEEHDRPDQHAQQRHESVAERLHGRRPRPAP